MTSRTFALSRHRRRRIPPAPADVVPSQDGLAHAAAPDEQPLGDETERVPSPHRDEAGVPADPATHSAGARPSAPRLPHEHDEHADAAAPPREPMRQAERDLASGQVDTDLRGASREVFDRATSRRRGRAE